MQSAHHMQVIEGKAREQKTPCGGFSKMTNNEQVPEDLS
jgi:hypothetical protein